MILTRNACPLALALFLLAPRIAHAQTVPTQATHDEIDHWLRGGDPRMVAWGATYAATSIDKAELPVLVALAENYRSLPPREFDARGNYVPRTPEQTQQLDAMQAVLDAILQLHGEVPHEVVTAVLPDFPAQALTLFATMPEPARTQHAVAVYETRDKSDQPYDWRHYGHQQMIHMAAAILALQPPPGFTATLLNETTVTLKISVTEDDQKRDGTFAVGPCGDSPNLVVAPGWPQPYTYMVEEHWRSEGPAEGVLVPGEPAIITRRTLNNSSCTALPGLTSAQKLLLAQQEAGILPNDDLGTGTLQYDTLRYPGPANFVSSLSDLIDRHRAPFEKLAATLAARSYLTAAESASVMPTFAVQINDQRKNRSQALPMPESLGSRTTVGPYVPKSGWFLEP